MFHDKLSLKERFVLLSLDNIRGYRLTNSIAMQMGVVGVILYEMFEKNIIVLSDDRIVIEKDFPTDTSFEFVKNHIKNHSHPPRLESLIKELRLHSHKLFSTIVKSLVTKEILLVVKKNIFGIFATKRFPTRYKIPELRLKKFLLILAKENRIPDEESYVLLRFINQCNLILPVFGLKNKKTVKKYIDLLKKDNGSFVVNKHELILFEAIKKASLSLLVSLA
ncbi:MAG: GPP34 family phosphoprotein [Salinivirgaceae bacterium]|nr:GPP34 family phosphoprotein [Salinivirgaceae bacterium]